MTSLDEYKALAKAQIEAGEYGAAIRSTTDALALDKTNTTLYLTRGLAYMMRKDYDLAVEDMTAVLALDHQNLDAILMRGSAYLQLGETDEALNDFNEFINIDPEHPNAPYGQRATACARDGRLQAALADYDLALEQQSNDRGKWLFERGTVKYALGDFAGSLADYDAAKAAGFKRPELYTAQGSAYANQGTMDAAEAAFSEAIALDRRDGEAYYNRGAVRLQQARFDEAIADFTQAIRFQDDHLNAHYARALAHMELQNYRDARRDLSAVLKADPQHAGAYWRRGMVYHKRGKVERALADFEQAVNLVPAESTYLTSLGELEIELETYDNAIGYLKRALLHHTNDASLSRCRILAGLALAYYLSAQDAECERYYNLLLEVDLIYGDSAIWRTRFDWSEALVEAATTMIAAIEANLDE